MPHSKVAVTYFPKIYSPSEDVSAQFLLCQGCVKKSLFLSIQQGFSQQACCWQCETCRMNQYVGLNGTACLDCPVGMKPVLNQTGCVNITVM